MATTAALALADVLWEFYELLDGSDDWLDDAEIADYLDREGYVLTGEYYLDLRRALRVLHQIIGESCVSATSLEGAE